VPREAGRGWFACRAWRNSNGSRVGLGETATSLGVSSCTRPAPPQGGADPSAPRIAGDKPARAPDFSRTLGRAPAGHSTAAGGLTGAHYWANVQRPPAPAPSYGSARSAGGATFIYLFN
jgi:hypothetical protein